MAYYKTPIFVLNWLALINWFAVDDDIRPPAEVENACPDTDPDGPTENTTLDEEFWISNRLADWEAAPLTIAPLMVLDLDTTSNIAPGAELLIPNSPLASITTKAPLTEDWASNIFPVPPAAGRIIRPL